MTFILKIHVESQRVTGKFKKITEKQSVEKVYKKKRIVKEKRA